MSQIYAMMVQDGMSTLELMLTGSNAKTRQAYSAAYANEAQRIAGRNRIDAAQKNLAAIQQDKILTNKSIQLQNTQAQAMTKLSAAVAGVTGNSVQDVSQQHNTNTAFAMAANDKQAKQLSDQFLAQINGTRMQLNGVQDQKISATGDLMETFGRYLEAGAADGQKALAMFGG